MPAAARKPRASGAPESSSQPVRAADKKKRIPQQAPQGGQPGQQPPYQGGNPGDNGGNNGGDGNVYDADYKEVD